MARVNVEEWAFGEGRLIRFAREMEWDLRQALGALVFLWHDSQEALRVAGSAEEMADWARASNRAEATRLVEALVSAKYINRKASGAYEIRGNEAQIENRLKFTVRAKKGGRATAKKWREEKAQAKRADKPRLEAMLDEGLCLASEGLKQAQCNAIQTNPMQSSAGQTSFASGPDGAGRDAEDLDPFAPQSARDPDAVLGPELRIDIPVGKKKPAKAKPPSLTGPTWAAYADAYYDRYKQEPKRNATVNSQLAAFVARVGAEESPHVIRHFLRSSKRFYVEKRHMVGLALADAEALWSQWKDGSHMTESFARGQDKGATTDAIFDQLIAEAEERERQGEPAHD
jgi:hypothetical protein